MYAQSYGMIKTKLYKKKGSKTQKKQYKMAWNGDYDGDKANIIIDIDNNGNKQKENITLNNEELMSMFNYPVHPMSLETRLTNDFNVSPAPTPDIYIIKASNKSRKKGHKRHKHYNTKSRNKRNRDIIYI
jgi:hypothetical protein